MKRYLAIVFAAQSLLALAAPTRADEAAIRQALAGKVRIDRILKTPYPGLFEVDFGKRLAYTNGAGSFLIVGNLVDVGSGRNLTQQRLRRLTAISFASLPLDLAIKTVRGAGRRTLAIFSDPLCPYCRREAKELAKLRDVTVYTFLTPFERVHPGATEKARDIWCAPDPAGAWRAFMLRGVEPPRSDCAAPIGTLIALGDKYGFSKTPTLVFADGAVVERVLSARRIEQLMDDSQ